MGRSAEFAEIDIPVVVLGFKSEFVHSRKKNVYSFLPLTSADEFADTGYEKIRRRNRFPVVVQSHVERLYFLRVIGQEHGLFINLFGEIPLVFALKVATPIYGELELVLYGFENFYSLGTFR